MEGKFAITDPSKSATAYMLVYGLLKQFGREGLEKIAANAVVTSSSVRPTRNGYRRVPGRTHHRVRGTRYVAGGQKEVTPGLPERGQLSRGHLHLQGRQERRSSQGFLQYPAQQGNAGGVARQGLPPTDPNGYPGIQADFTPRHQIHQDLPAQPGSGLGRV